MDNLKINFGILTVLLCRDKLKFREYFAPKQMKNSLFFLEMYYVINYKHHSHKKIPQGFK